ncbi:hypothetical protein [Pedobacter alpinus]|uniref:Outer membrane protein beta-barrel domain-containing protein n=1 Tax=Pedobacter alpinus TaxID=1590643 RepID=A0ABW5TV73_9SPHI
MNSKLKTKYVYFSVFIISLILTSCSSVYMPNVPNSPMLSAKNEIHASGHISLRGKLSFNTAYAVSDHIGVLFNGSFINQSQRKKDFNQELVELGGGYYTTFGTDNNRILEIYGGFGRGTTNRIYRTYDNDLLVFTDNQNVRFNKSFIQVNYSSKEKKSLTLFSKKYPLNYGTIIRLSHVNMSNFTRNNLAQPLEDNIFIEPVFFTRLKLNQNFQLQYTSGSNFGLKNRDFMTAGSSVFTLGLIVNLGGK